MNIVVIGAGYAGTMAALRLAGKSKGANITLINAADTFVERIRLHELAAGKSPRRHLIADMLRGKNVAFVQARVTAIDPARNEVTLEDRAPIRYDYLVYALGSSVDQDAVPGIREHALTLGSAEAARQMQAKLGENPNARILVCGGGLTGIELTAEIAEMYPNASLALLSRQPLGNNMSQKARAYARHHFDKRSVRVREGITIARVLADGVLTESGEHVTADLVLWAGSFGVPSLARDSGIAVNRRGQITVDPYLRSVSHPDIFAVGDSAASGLRMSCQLAIPLGAHAADNLAALLRGAPLQPFRFGFVGRCVSLGRHDGLVQIDKADDTPREAIITGRAAALIKEMVCRFTVKSLLCTRSIPGIAAWPKPGHEAIHQPEQAAARQHA